MSKYNCAKCGSAALIKYGNVSMETEGFDPKKGKVTRILVDYNGLGTWRCSKGCRDARGKTPVKRSKGGAE